MIQITELNLIVFLIGIPIVAFVGYLLVFHISEFFEIKNRLILILGAFVLIILYFMCGYFYYMGVR